MKKTVILLLLTITNIQLNAQKKDSLLFNKKHEINIGFFNAFDLGGTNSFGIGYKYHYAKGAFRISIDYSSSSSNTNSDGTYNYNSQFPFVSVSKSSNATISPRIGYEFHEYYKKLMLYYGIDVKVKYYQNKNKITYTKYAINDSIQIDNDSSSYQSFSYGLSPFIGLKYQFNSRFSLSTETSLNILNAHSTYKKNAYYSDGSTYSQNNTNNDTNVSLSPLGTFSFNIHF